MKPIFLSLLLLVWHSSRANSTTLSTFYREIDATPYDFIYALKTVGPETKSASQNGGRLQKYYKLIHKETIGNKTDISVQFQSDFMPSILQEFAMVTISLVQLKDENNAKRFQTNLIFNKMVMANGLLSVTAHPRGSLLKMEVQEANLPIWIFKSAVDMLFKINLSSSENKSNLQIYKPPAG